MKCHCLSEQLRQRAQQRASATPSHARSVAEGHGLHVEEADVHLGLNVDPLPDLQWREWRQEASPPPPEPCLSCPGPAHLLLLLPQQSHCLLVRSRLGSRLSQVTQYHVDSQLLDGWALRAHACPPISTRGSESSLHTMSLLFLSAIPGLPDHAAHFPDSGWVSLIHRVLRRLRGCDVADFIKQRASLVTITSMG